MMNLFHSPSSIHFGAGCRHGLPDALAALGVSRPLLVTDEGLWNREVIAPFVAELRVAGLVPAVFTDVQPDPTDKNVANGTTAYEAHQADCLVAIGGGSPIDAAKVIAASIANPGPIAQFQGYHRIRRRGPLLVAVPTTAGTGSEATKVAVITDTERNIKMMMLDASLMPQVAFVDPELSATMPPALTAYVGVDTLTHGLEAFVSRKANAMTDPLALSCLRLCAQHLHRAWQRPEDMEARTGMALAALHGGMAFSNSSVCLVHGMSRPLGALFHVAHGLSNAMLLPEVTAYSLTGNLTRYAEASRLLGFAKEAAPDEEAARALPEGLCEWNRKLQVPSLPTYLRAGATIFEASLPKMAQDALASGSPGNNPVVPSAAEIEALYRRIWRNG